jgi:ATP-dependent helicase/nuclease subunit B
VRHLHTPEIEPCLSPTLAARLHGTVLRTSVSRLEQFAACPFKFFVHSGLRAEERLVFELDAKEQGTFQHDLLALFHDQLAREGKRWRDLAPAQARDRLATLAQALMTGFRDGLLQANEQSRFTANLLVESLQDFIEVVIGWMHTQYQFDPVAVELPFGEDPAAPAWRLDLAEGFQLEIYGRIDRIDLFREPGKDDALCVVVDYKSSPKHLDPVLMAHGLQLQLPIYLSVLRHWPSPVARFGVQRLIPAGVFYVNLRGRYERGHNRSEALIHADQARKLAYQHTGRFDARVLPRLDSRADVLQGDQFNYRLTKGRKLVKNSREAMNPAAFEAMLQSLESNLRDMGRAIFSGRADVAPFRKGPIKACDQCVYQAICRVDPWTQRYRVLEPRALKDPSCAYAPVAAGERR